LLFREGRLSIGLVLPLRAADRPDVDFAEQVDLARTAEELGFSAIWVRDVPLNGAWYPEAFGHPDPMVMLGAIAVSPSAVSEGVGLASPSTMLRANTKTMMPPAIWNDSSDIPIA
jgi:alkanesulfonate monooxygenase SsuD/methylene tetrahydromethanopterin reductase-like flavin-dependent oxidoreductase (luciferase family)